MTDYPYPIVDDTDRKCFVAESVRDFRLQKDEALASKDYAAAHMAACYLDTWQSAHKSFWGTLVPK